MSDFPGFNSSYLSSNPQSPSSGGNSASPSANDDLTKQKSLNIPSIQIKRESSPANDLLSKSTDIKKQLSQSFGGGGGISGSAGGITKPQSRKNSIIPIKSNNASDNEDDDDENQGNERKRRDNINEKIQELLTLIPSEFFQDVNDHNNNVNNNNNNNNAKTSNHNNQEEDNDAAIAAAMKNSGTKDGKPNKGQILTKSVEYLQFLQNLIDENNRREVELQMKLNNLKLQEAGKPTNTPVNLGNTSAEFALGEIGVGPLSDDYFKLVLVSSVGTNKSGQRRASLV